MHLISFKFKGIIIEHNLIISFHDYYGALIHVWYDIINIELVTTGNHDCARQIKSTVQPGKRL